MVDHDGSENVEPISVEMLEVGDIVRVLPGASPPSDAIIVSDDGSSFNEASLTGESRPVTKTKGDEVFTGTINLAKPITVKVTVRTGETVYVTLRTFFKIHCLLIGVVLTKSFRLYGKDLPRRLRWNESQIGSRATSSP